MSEWDDGYGVAVLYDTGKLLLKSRPGKDYSGAWRGNHAAQGKPVALLNADDAD